LDETERETQTNETDSVAPFIILGRIPGGQFFHGDPHMGTGYTDSISAGEVNR
jgi:hypothetical protein